MAFYGRLVNKLLHEPLIQSVLGCTKTKLGRTGETRCGGVPTKERPNGDNISTKKRASAVEPYVEGKTDK